jgi:hypothetical protein
MSVSASLSRIVPRSLSLSVYVFVVALLLHGWAVGPVEADQISDPQAVYKSVGLVVLVQLGGGWIGLGWVRVEFYGVVQWLT